MGMKPPMHEPAGPSPANVNTSGSTVPGHYAGIANAGAGTTQKSTGNPQPANTGAGTTQKGPVPTA